jgi:uncharacterized protein (TIGR02145 family)
MKKIIIVCLLTLSLEMGFSQTTYTFNGKGDWSVSANWSNNIIPPSTLPSGSIIYISPIVGDTCILNFTQTISQGASLIVTTGAKFVISGNLFSDNFPTVTICNQTWTAKNLDVNTYRNGDPIPQVTDPTAWVNLTTGAWCWYNNDSATYASTYGKLYNWYAVNDPRGLAPIGWHIPTDAEWAVLSTCLGGDGVAGGAMKEAGTTHWNSPNGGATNSSGFTALPGGARGDNGANTSIFQNVGNEARFWSSTEQDAINAFFRLIQDFSAPLYRSGFGKDNGLSVRCVRG